MKATEAARDYSDTPFGCFLAIERKIARLEVAYEAEFFSSRRDSAPGCTPVR
jgi:hypothetical protein